MSKLWGYEEMKNPDAKVNIGAVEAKTLYLLGRGVLTYWIYHPTLYILSYDVMIYTYVNMYIAFVTPVMDVRDRGQI